MLGLSGLMFALSPWAKSANDFFRGSRNEKEPSLFMLTGSLVISWLFAKSITNAADLGQQFGLVGTVAYAAYYCSFFVAAYIIYALRTKGGFKSIHHFLETRYGRGALFLFSLIIAFRLMNEIWSNSIVIGQYFGPQGSREYYLAILVFTVLTLAYTMKGGFRSSLFTDMLQMMLFVVLLVFVLSFVLPSAPGGVKTLVSSGSWKLDQGVNLLLVAFLQSISYPFHDPVMTDRGFISEPVKARKAFLAAGFIGIACILLFGFVGILGKVNGLGTPVVAEVSKLFGTSMMLAINLIMLASAASTIDSTFASSTKLVHLDILKGRNLNVGSGRITMAILALLGTLPVFFNPAVLSATTISGTMVLGLAPVFIFWYIDAPKISFYLAVGSGLLAGICLVFFPLPSTWLLSKGKYADLLTMNVWGTLIAFAGFLVPYYILKRKV